MTIVQCPSCAETIDIDLSVHGDHECPYCRRHVGVSRHGGQRTPVQETSASQQFLSSSRKFLVFSATVVAVSFFTAFLTTDPWSGDSVPVVGDLSVITFFVALPVTGLAAVVFVIALLRRGLEMLANR